MPVVVIAILCGLAATIGWGIADFLAAKASRNIGPVTSVIACNIIGAIGFALFYFFGHGLSLPVGEPVRYAIAAGICFGVGQIAFFKGLNIGPVSLVSPLSSAYPFITTLLVVLFFNAHLSALIIIGLTIILFGVVLASELHTVKQNERKLGKGPVLALMTSLTWGVGYALSAKALQSLDWQSVSLVQIIFLATTCILVGPFAAGKEKLFKHGTIHVFKNPFILIAGSVQMFGMVIINVGIAQDTNMAPVVTAISACYPVLTILLALGYFRESVQKTSLSGAFLTILGVVLLSFG